MLSATTEPVPSDGCGEKCLANILVDGQSKMMELAGHVLGATVSVPVHVRLFGKLIARRCCVGFSGGVHDEHATVFLALVHRSILQYNE